MSDDRTLREQICSFAAAHGFAGADPDDLRLLALGGSDRRFYRVPAGNTTCVAMVSPDADEQNAWLAINRFLRSCAVSVPQVYACDGSARILLVEDAGDENLCRSLHAASERTTVLELYQRALTLLAELQVRATPRMQSCPCLRARRFGYAAFRAETDYFIRSFLREYCRMEAPHGLDEEFHRLAQTLAAEPAVFMHRDFQSQNIHLACGRMMVIDFQTATAGPPHYDLASLLKDAYFVLNPGERDLLLRHYFSSRAALGSPVHDTAAFIRTFHLCGLQRNMQALAAFSFLGTYKKKTHFYAHIPTALDCLKEALSILTDYPRLHATIAAAHGNLSVESHNSAGSMLRPI